MSICITPNQQQFSKFSIMENPFEALAKEINNIKVMLVDFQKINKQSDKAMPEILSLQEAAEFLRLSPSKMYDLTHKGDIPHFKQGAGKSSRVLFSRSDLLQWLQQFKQIDKASAIAGCDSFMAKNR